VAELADAQVSEARATIPYKALKPRQVERLAGDFNASFRIVSDIESALYSPEVSTNLGALFGSLAMT